MLKRLHSACKWQTAVEHFKRFYMQTSHINYACQRPVIVRSVLRLFLGACEYKFVFCCCFWVFVTTHTRTSTNSRVQLNVKHALWLLSTSTASRKMDKRVRKWHRKLLINIGLYCVCVYSRFYLNVRYHHAASSNSIVNVHVTNMEHLLTAKHQYIYSWCKLSGVCGFCISLHVHVE